MSTATPANSWCPRRIPMRLLRAAIMSLLLLGALAQGDGPYRHPCHEPDPGSRAPKRAVVLTNEGTEAPLALGVVPAGAVKSWLGEPWYGHIAHAMAGVESGRHGARGEPGAGGGPATGPDPRHRTTPRSRRFQWRLAIASGSASPLCASCRVVRASTIRTRSPASSSASRLPSWAPRPPAPPTGRTNGSAGPGAAATAPRTARG